MEASPFPTENVSSFAARLGEAVYDPFAAGDSGYVYLTKRFHEFYLARAAATRPGHQIEFVFLNSPVFNAWAARESGRDMIAINNSVPPILGHLFSRLLSDPICLPWIGDAARESFERLVSDDDVHGQLLTGPFRRPTDAPRQGAGGFMARWALSWIFEHELGHIWNGHVDLIQERVGISAIDELSVASRTGLTDLDLQTLEMDADSFATQIVLTHMVENALADPESYKLILNPEFEAIGKGASIVYIAMYTIYFIFRSFDEAFDSGPPLDRRTHPPAPMRQAIALGTCITVLQKRVGISYEVTGKISGLVTIDAEEAFARLTGRNAAFGDIKSLTSGPYHEYVMKIMRNWSSLRPDLQRLKRGSANLAPPF